ncbi:MAG: GNAT family N-acetyltransferase [Rhodospirillaceae bacterium]|mgnify:FL=1|jgi:GNAT superfamily N-acetyltransferase|uniref:GNAT family N-acetyltransferase n=2 Tax=unclassified Hwanghaeella TaxID=2605944 RepID=UPI000C49C0E7|nr:GNAT family N-acetyltransferase [Rhodospirillales bacterium]MAX46918.1 GNAT family N-acetyltransferase [Rhodospirillaceae bacterium]|tara:strand:- start:88466 stop:88960 length:495 start_codon:yes stop_codon:yes gene_type:complete
MVVDEVERMETGPLEIVRAGENDADLVAIMVHRLLHEIGAWHGAPDDERIHAVCRQLLEEDNQFSALLAFDMERRPVGVMTLTEAVAIYAEGRLGIIMELYVVPDARSAGIGDRLIQEARQIGKSRGWKLLEVNSPDGEEWTRTRAFYERQGFRHVGPFMKLEL